MTGRREAPFAVPLKLERDTQFWAGGLRDMSARAMSPTPL
jgi:hypothetical protein